MAPEHDLRDNVGAAESMDENKKIYIPKRKERQKRRDRGMKRERERERKVSELFFAFLRK